MLYSAIRLSCTQGFAGALFPAFSRRDISVEIDSQFAMNFRLDRGKIAVPGNEKAGTHRAAALTASSSEDAHLLADRNTAIDFTLPVHLTSTVIHGMQPEALSSCEHKPLHVLCRQSFGVADNLPETTFSVAFERAVARSRQANACPETPCTYTRRGFRFLNQNFQARISVRDFYNLGRIRFTAMPIIQCSAETEVQSSCLYWPVTLFFSCRVSGWQPRRTRT